jgi:hypothetical protein
MRKIEIEIAGNKKPAAKRKADNAKPGRSRRACRDCSISNEKGQMTQHELPTKTIRALWRMAGDEGITIEELRKRLLDERLEREGLEHEQFQGKIVNEICLGGDTYMVALSKGNWRVLWREAGNTPCTIDELVEKWVEQWAEQWRSF